MPLFSAVRAFCRNTRVKTMSDSLVTASISAGGSNATIAIKASGTYSTGPGSAFSATFSEGVFALLRGISAHYNETNYTPVQGMTVVFAGEGNVPTPPFYGTSSNGATTQYTHSPAAMTSTTLILQMAYSSGYQYSYYNKSGIYTVFG